MSGTSQWTIKGLPLETIKSVRVEAKNRGMKQFEFLDRAIKFYIGREKPSALEILDYVISVSKKPASERTSEELALSGALKELATKL